MGHVLFISPYYPPEKAAAAVCVSEVAKRLAERGHQVTVLTTVPNYPTGIVPKEYRGHLLQEEMRDGVRVVRVWSYISANRFFFRRILAQLAFGCLSPLLGGKAVGSPDIILVHSPPLFGAIAARVLARLKRCPYIFMVADPWPTSAVQLGMLHNRILIRLSEWLEMSTYQRASLVWVVSEGVFDLLEQRGLSPECLFLCHNGVDTSRFRPMSREQARAELGWDRRFIVLYVGNHGLAQGLRTILEAAEQLVGKEHIHFIFVGDGVQKGDLLAHAQSKSLKNISFLDAQPHELVPQLLAAADICLVPLRDLPILETTLPIKMFEVMACGRPFVLGARGIARQIAEKEAGAAIAVEPENAQELASAIVYLAEHPEVAEALGRRGRTYAVERFDYNNLVASLDERIALLLARAHPSL
jgi:putative colanic acid biosynthesis glycosyltransferase WcaI